MNPLLRRALLAALLLSTGATAEEAAPAPPVEVRTEYIQRIALPGFTGYVIDIDCFRPQPTFGAPLQPPCARGNAARLWRLSGAPLHEMSLVLDGVPASGWRVFLPYP